MSRLESRQILRGQCLENGVEYSAYYRTSVDSEKPEKVEENVGDDHGRQGIAQL